MLQTTPLLRHYDAARARRGVSWYIARILDYPGVTWRNRYLVANFFRRELLGRFRGSLLGIFWVLVQPIFMFVVYYLVFGILFGNYKIGQPPDSNFAFFLFSGVVFFQCLSEGTASSCNVVVGNGNLVKKVAFPSEVLPIPDVLVSLTVYLVGILVCMLAWLVCQAVGLPVSAMQPGWMLLALPLTLAVQFVMMLGLGLFLANLYVFSRDVRHLWGIIATAWMFLTPVFWRPYIMESKVPGLAQTLATFNPAYSLIMAQRIALGATDVPGELDGNGMPIVEFDDFWGKLGNGALWALVFLLIGYGMFMSRKHKYADLV